MKHAELKKAYTAEMQAAAKTAAASTQGNEFWAEVDRLLNKTSTAVAEVQPRPTASDK